MLIANFGASAVLYVLIIDGLLLAVAARAITQVIELSRSRRFEETFTDFFTSQAFKENGLRITAHFPRSDSISNRV